MHDFDIIITGAGAAGLSLAYHLNQAGLADKRILLLDRAPKIENDRTWCFWERDDNAFESIVFRQWNRVAFYGQGFSEVLDLVPYRYKMIRGIDFYEFMSRWLAQQPNITRVFADVARVDERDGYAIAQTSDGRTFRGTWAFNSIQFEPPPKLPNRHYMLQHFLGWVIQTPDRMFDPKVATLMDFRIDQADDTRFVYVLPLDEHTALVEYTVFSRELLNRQDYVAALESYIRDVLKIERYEEQHEEFGVIPMTDAPYPAQHGSHVFNIGTAGGRSKPSTGYTFQRIQRQSAQIAHAIKTTGTPVVAMALPGKR